MALDPMAVYLQSVPSIASLLADWLSRGEGLEDAVVFVTHRSSAAFASAKKLADGCPPAVRWSGPDVVVFLAPSKEAGVGLVKAWSKGRLDLGSVDFENDCHVLVLYEGGNCTHLRQPSPVSGLKGLRN